MTFYEIAGPSIVGEVIDGEAVVMDLDTGNYFSMRNLGAMVWTFITAGNSGESIQSMIIDNYPEASGNASVDLRAFIEQLLGAGLIKLSSNSMQDSQPESALLSTIERYEAPILESFTDMQELLLLDPVHDVAETGWPEPSKQQ
ncbi:MAG: hypothetical protein ACJASY_003778 [Halioglobus sp.]|jgi:hypothetical protein